MKKLYRPVGAKELELILDTGCRKYPDRLPTQPIFYPVLNLEYAIEIAQKWNTKDINSSFSGYVTAFKMKEEDILQYEIHIVGAAQHKELWVPAEELPAFNAKIITPIRITHAFYGEQYVGKENWSNYNDYVEQLIQLKKLKEYNPMDFSCMVQSDWKAITKNFIAWLYLDSTREINSVEKGSVLSEIKEILVKNHKWFFEI